MRALGKDRLVLAESESMVTSGSDALVRWRDDGSTCEGRTAWLQFVFERATVYSFCLGSQRETKSPAWPLSANQPSEALPAPRP